ncbi:MAG: dockerin type I repeat-containing protein [Planctomycetota bacterium]
MSQQRKVFFVWLGGLVSLFAIGLAPVGGSTVSWVGDENDNWHVGNNWTPNWSCGDIFCIQVPPQADDDAFVNDPTFGTSVELTSHAAVRTLNISNGMDVDLAGYQLAAVDGLITSSNRITIDGLGTTLRVAGGNPNYDLYTNRFRIANGGQLRMAGSPHVAVTNAATSVITASSGLVGNGSIRWHNFGPLGSTVLSNDGFITVTSNTLTLSLEDDGRFDLDGSSGSGVLNVDDGNSFFSRSLTLNVEGELADNFDGTLSIGKGDRAHFTHPWRLGTPLGPGSRVELNGYDGTATLSGAPVIMDDGLGRIEVQGGTARIESDLSIYAGRIVVSPHTTLEFAGNGQFHGETVIDNSAAPQHEFRVTGDLVIQDSIFDWDGPTNEHVVTISGGRLAMAGNLGDFGRHGGQLNVIGTPASEGVLEVTAGSWFVEGQLLLDGRDQLARVTGSSPLSIGTGNTNPRPQLVVEGAARIETGYLELEDDAAVTLNPGSVLTLATTTEVEPDVVFAGTGRMINEGAMYALHGAQIGGVLQNEGLFWIGTNFTGHYAQVGLADFDQAAVGETRFDLRPSSQGDSDQLQLLGNATLGGRLHIDANLPMAMLGDQFVLIDAQAINGQFGEAQLPQAGPGELWRVIYTPDQVLLRLTVSGDFNQDQQFDCQDVDALVAEIASPNGDLRFDLSGDGQLDQHDLSLWLIEAGAANLPRAQAYPVGDANLDGTVDGQDFVIWNDNKFGASAAWCAGDLNADGFVDGLDFVLWNGNKFTSVFQAVPEPHGGGFLVLLGLLLRRR